jgi:cytochrome P450
MYLSCLTWLPKPSVVSRWRKMRRAANDGFSVRAVTRYQPIQAKAAIRLVLNIISQPDVWKDSVQV